MKKLLVSFLVSMGIVSVVGAQERLPYQLVEEKPLFNGGDIKAFVHWVNSCTVYPQEMKAAGIQGRVIVQFIVEADGCISNVEALRALDPVLDAEAVRAVSSSPKWTPGKQQGNAVSVICSIPVFFYLKENSEAHQPSAAPSVEGVETIPLKLVEEKPSFRGGNANDFSYWVNSHLVYPDDAKAEGIQGKVALQFTVDTDGSVINVKVLKGVYPSLDAEAVRVVSSSPKWIPGKQGGKAVRVTYTFPVIFGLRR